MEYALVENIRLKATNGVKGICQICGSELIAKCGSIKINHWAHMGTRNCDPWWENETEWHRTWKNNFYKDWHEIVLTDETTGEKHIADIRTIHGLVIEFQHSHLDPVERTKREGFYKNMVWVVDGTRLKRDYPRFLKSNSQIKKTEKKGIFLVDFVDEVFPTNWVNSSVPVIFDFKGIEALSDNTDKRKKLYCLLQVRQGIYSILAEIPREVFIKTTINGEWATRIQNYIESLKPKKEIPKQERSNIHTRHREGTHYYDQKKGKFVKKWRF
ncbi:MAG: competence protein [Saprospiraceae bacterium]|nr:competence protein [Saprospiraceae bacterium]